MMLFQTNGECELKARWLCQNGSVCALIFPFKTHASFWEGLGQKSSARQVWWHPSLRDTQVRHRQGLALGMLLAVGQGWGPKVEWENQNSDMLELSCVCQGTLPWVWEKLGCFASLTLEHGDELIKPLGNWTSVTFTLDQYEYIFHFLVSRTLCPTLRYSCEMLLWGAFPAPNHGILEPHVNIFMKTSYHLNPIKVCEVLLWSFSPKADVQNRSGEPFLQGEIALYHPAERAWFPPHHQMTKGRKNVSQLEGSGGSADIWKTAAKADLQALHLW